MGSLTFSINPGGPRCLKYQNVPKLPMFWLIGKPWERFQSWVIRVYFISVPMDHTVARAQVGARSNSRRQVPILFVPNLTFNPIPTHSFHYQRNNSGEGGGQLVPTPRCWSRCYHCQMSSTFFGSFKYPIIYILKWEDDTSRVEFSHDSCHDWTKRGWNWDNSIVISIFWT